jgi:hypothetical protein
MVRFVSLAPWAITLLQKVSSFQDLRGRGFFRLEQRLRLAEDQNKKRSINYIVVPESSSSLCVRCFSFVDSGVQCLSRCSGISGVGQMSRRVKKCNTMEQGQGIQLSVVRRLV